MYYVSPSLTNVALLCRCKILFSFAQFLGISVFLEWESITKSDEELTRQWVLYNFEFIYNSLYTLSIYKLYKFSLYNIEFYYWTQK